MSFCIRRRHIDGVDLIAKQAKRRKTKLKPNKAKPNIKLKIVDIGRYAILALFFSMKMTPFQVCLRKKKAKKRETNKELCNYPMRIVNNS